jgi:hypothetical protein
MIASHLLIIHSETYRAFVEARRQRAWARRECLRLQHRMSMQPPLPPEHFLVMQNEIASLLEEAEEKSPESVTRN